jgi:hypothetical protein
MVNKNKTTSTSPATEDGLNFAALFPQEDAPQQPFLPRVTPAGPSFLDTEACLCAFRPLPDITSGKAAWQCIGNQTQNVYVANTGKWFRPQNDPSNASFVNGSAIDDASNPPDTGSTLLWDESKTALVDATAAGLAALSVFDGVCTGTNNTQFSTSFYRTANELATNSTPIDATLCWRPGALSVQVQNVSDWQTNGCPTGFLCKSFSIVCGWGNMRVVLTSTLLLKARITLSIRYPNTAHQ